MTLRGMSVVASAVLGLCGFVPQEVFRATTDVVSVDVAVKSGRVPVTGLTSADFTLLDNGVSQQIDAVSPESLPIDVTLALDVSGSTYGSIMLRLDAAVRETAALLTPRDRLRLIAISESAREVFDFQAGGTMPQAMLTLGGATSLYDGIIAAMMNVRPPERRHLIIAFTDGEDTASFFGFAGAREIALRCDAVLHVVLASALRLTTTVVQSGRPGTISLSAVPARPPNSSILRLTEATGGAVVVLGTGSSIGRAFTQVIEDFRTSYVLRYTAKGVKREGWHDVIVAVKKPGVYDVRARKGYSGSATPSR